MSDIRTISINSRDLPYSIDTYGMFTGESTAENECDYYYSEYPAIAELVDAGKLEIGFDYDHAAIVAELAGSSIAIIEQAIHFEKPPVVIGVPIIKNSGSPQFYNYTSDHYTADWTLDIDELRKQVPADWRNKAVENGWDAEALGDDHDETESGIVAMLELYLRDHLTEDEYNESMWEYESEAYSNHMTPDTDLQAALDAISDQPEATA